MNRATRLGIGLVALIPVLGITGGLIAATDLAGETAAWIVFGVGLTWIAVMIWWTLRAPPLRSEEASARYWVALRHARFQPQHDADDRVGQRR